MQVPTISSFFPIGLSLSPSLSYMALSLSPYSQIGLQVFLPRVIALISLCVCFKRSLPKISLLSWWLSPQKRFIFSVFLLNQFWFSLIICSSPLIGCFSPPSEGTCPGGGSAGAGGRLEELQGRLIRHCHHSGLLLGGDHRHRLKQWICKSLSPAQMETAWPSTVWGLACPWPEAGSAAGKQGSPGRGLIDWSPLSPGGPTLRASNPLFPQTKLIGRNTWGEQPIH